MKRLSRELVSSKAFLPIKPLVSPARNAGAAEYRVLHLKDSYFFELACHCYTFRHVSYFHFFP